MLDARITKFTGAGGFSGVSLFWWIRGWGRGGGLDGGRLEPGSVAANLRRDSRLGQRRTDGRIGIHSF